MYRVLITGGRVLVDFATPENTVTSGNCDTEVVVLNAVSTTAGAVKVLVVTAGVGAMTVDVGASGARPSSGAATMLALESRLSLAAAMRLRAYSMSTARSAFLAYRWNLGDLVGVASAAG
jgi:hypothetical protein